MVFSPSIFGKTNTSRSGESWLPSSITALGEVLHLPQRFEEAIRKVTSAALLRRLQAFAWRSATSRPED
jgi:hypothetical protein